MNQPPSVLVMDDDPACRAATCGFLAAKGYHLSVARDARQGLEAVAQLAPDLVLCDLMLPDESGFRVLERIRLMPQPVPVVLLASVSGPALWSLAALSGAAAVLRKPLSMNRLFEVVSQLCPFSKLEPLLVSNSHFQAIVAHVGS